MKVFYWIILVLCAATVNCNKFINIMPFLEEQGAYVSITSLKSEAEICMYHSDRPAEELPSECSCSFEHLKRMEERCASIEELADVEIKMKCQELPCEMCCKVLFDKIALPGHGKAARFECVKKCPSSEMIMDVTGIAAPAVLAKLQELSQHYFPVAPTVKPHPLKTELRASDSPPIITQKSMIDEIPLKSEAEAMEERVEKISNLEPVIPPPTVDEINRLSQENEKLVESANLKTQIKHIPSPFEEI